jgi:hypoxanthine phosphoribosyltransferase
MRLSSALLHRLRRLLQAGLMCFLACLQCPDRFVIGYGLDFNEKYRSLPYVGVLRPECYQ